jgi:hypothetical protein
MDYSRNATYYRTALLLGLVQGEEVHRWGERVVERDPEPPQAILEILSTSPRDLSELRHALWPLSLEPEPVAVVRAMFALLQADLESGKRGMADTVTVLRQMRSMLRLPSALYQELNSELVKQATDSTVIQHWLRGFANEHRNFLAF